MSVWRDDFHTRRVT